MDRTIVCITCILLDIDDLPALLLKTQNSSYAKLKHLYTTFVVALELEHNKHKCSAHVYMYSVNIVS